MAGIRGRLGEGRLRAVAEVSQPLGQRHHCAGVAGVVVAGAVVVLFRAWHRDSAGRVDGDSPGALAGSCRQFFFHSCGVHPGVCSGAGVDCLAGDSVAGVPGGTLGRAVARDSAGDHAGHLLRRKSFAVGPGGDEPGAAVGLHHHGACQGRERNGDRVAARAAGRSAAGGDIQRAAARRPVSGIVRGGKLVSDSRHRGVPREQLDQPRLHDGGRAGDFIFGDVADAQSGGRCRLRFTGQAGEIWLRQRINSAKRLAKLRKPVSRRTAAPGCGSATTVLRWWRRCSCLA